MNIKRYLQLFNDKPSPDRISLRYEDALKNDIFSVYIVEPNTKKNYLFEEYNNDILKVREWNDAENKFTDIVLLPDDSLKEDSFSGVYYFKAHQLPFESLEDITWIKREVFKLRANINNYQMSKNIYEYEQQQLHIKERIDVLGIVVNKYLMQTGSDPVNLLSVLQVAMKTWPFLSRSTREELKKKINLYLEGFVSSGDLNAVDEYNFVPNGQALLTLERFSLEQDRFLKTARIQNYSLLTAVFAAIAAAVSAYAAFLDKGT
ncbi:TPA: hypothetical protein RQO08_002929 [Klebsiella oxytoca]|uniref:hypothetical protein n=1 Tax=Klebsiella oxytoca TaxID=571 RepID=UPI00288ECF13|nr:hypothetical protein [Klebsiella oxytoca]